MAKRSADSHLDPLEYKRTNDLRGNFTVTSGSTARQHISRLPSLDWAQWKRPSCPRRPSASSSAASVTLVEPPSHDPDCHRCSLPKRRQPKHYAFFSDPFETRILWEQVQARKAMPKGSKIPLQAERAKGKVHGRSQTSSVPSIDTKSDAPSSAASVTTTTNDTSFPNKKAKATTRDSDFEVTQLRPRGISIVFLGKDQETSESEPHRHFGTTRPSDHEQVVDHYIRESGVSTSSTVWVSQSDEFCKLCASEYQHLKLMGLPEREYEVLALETVLLRTRTSQLRSDIREAMVVRMVGPSLRPRELWDEPPLLGEEPIKPFQFDIYPDCQYYLSPRLISTSYRARLESILDVTANFAFLPYLTVEFKCDGKSVTIVQNQIAAAASISLYNRYRLKVKGLRARGQEGNQQTAKKDWNNVRHYGLSIESTQWTIWTISPKLSDHTWTWEGCTMKKVTRGNCHDPLGFAYLATWVNEIHLWAHQQYSPDCEEDLKWCFERSGSRTSLGITPGIKAP